MSDTPRTDEAWAAVSRTPDGMFDSRVPVMSFALAMSEHSKLLERELEQERQDREQADIGTIRALGERNDAREELRAAVEALKLCREDSAELLAERSWWKYENRRGYRDRYDETVENILKADEILAKYESR